MSDAHFLAIHGHFYQSPRGNPFTGKPLVDESATPYNNWIERITAECYQPNADLGNFEHISFDLGELLADWLETNDPETYNRIIQADALHPASQLYNHRDW